MVAPTSPDPTDFQLFHNYNRLVRRGFTKPLRHSCEDEFVLAIGDDDRVTLKCFGCNTTTYPGLKMLRDIEAVVKEHLE